MKTPPDLRQEASIPVGLSNVEIGRKPLSILPTHQN